ncbi:MAG: hypothetical protein JO232_09945 [Verrucomicrobia bacterium]|nr:hypothetical protein [Verrucomicrobiota bacterium]
MNIKRRKRLDMISVSNCLATLSSSPVQVCSMRSVNFVHTLLAIASTIVFAAAAGKPVILTSAPNPQLSYAAWAEIVARRNAGKGTSFQLAIHVKNGLVTSVEIVNPCGADLVEQEVRDWVLKKWSFEADFSGDKVQPMALNLKTEKEQKPRAEEDRRRVLLASPPPLFPESLRGYLKEYQAQEAKAGGVLVRIVVKSGQVTDIRTVDYKGPTELSIYTTRWVLEHWRFKPDVTGIYFLPVFYVAH